MPEFWRYNGRKLEVFVLEEGSNVYQQVEASGIFPWLALDAIPRFINQSLIDGETATLRAFRLWVREQQMR